MESGSASCAVQSWPTIVAVWALLAGLPLALRPLMPVDETRYASVAWEMWTRGGVIRCYTPMRSCPEGVLLLGGRGTWYRRR